MKSIEPVDIETLQSRLLYDPETGAIKWKERPDNTSWNARFAGHEAMNTVHSDGYLTGKIERRRVYAHRVAYALHHGHWPSNMIDHINGDRSDNRISNLREVGPEENARNKRDNILRSGVEGIWWLEGAQMWRVVRRRAGKKHCLGSYKELDQAIDALKKFEAQAAEQEM